MVDGAGVTEPATTVPSDGTVQPAAVQPNPGDFDARVRQGGDFALEQVKAAQRELSKMKTKLGGVEPIVDAVGGAEALTGHLRRLNAVVSNPAMRSLVEEFERTGVAPTAKAVAKAQHADVDDSYEEPWDAALNVRTQEIASLRAELNSLRGERGVEKVQNFFKSFEANYPLDDEARQHLTETLAKQAQQWANDPQGLNVLKNMNYETFESLALGKLGKDRVRQAV